MLYWCNGIIPLYFSSTLLVDSKGDWEIVLDGFCLAVLGLASRPAVPVATSVVVPQMRLELFAEADMASGREGCSPNLKPDLGDQLLDR